MIFNTYIYLFFLAAAAAMDAIPNRFHGDDGAGGMGHQEWDNSFELFSEEDVFRAQEADEVVADGITIPAWEQGSQRHKRGYTGVDIWRGHVAYHQDGFESTGVSYYLRAYDMFPKWYMAQYGWGQWTAQGGSGEEVGTPCARNPRLATCKKVNFPNPALDDMDTSDCSWPEGDERLHKCNFGVCGKEKQPIYGTFEGGVGYWPYMTGSNGVKWMRKYNDNSMPIQQSRQRNSPHLLGIFRPWFCFRQLRRQVRGYVPQHSQPALHPYGGCGAAFEQHPSFD